VLATILAMAFSALALIPMMVLGVISTKMLELPTNDIFDSIGINMMTLFMFLQLVVMLFVIAIFRKFVDRKSILSLGLEFSGYKMDLLKGLVWGAGLIAVGFLFLYAFDFIFIINVDLGGIKWLSYITLFAIIAFNEEILIRGYVLTNLMASMNKYWALIWSSIIFLLIHLSNDNMTFISIVNLLLAGIMLGIYTIHKSNLWFPLGMHFSWNFFQGPILGFAVSGLKVESVISQEITGNRLITGGQFGFEGSLLLTLMMIVSTLLIHIKYINTLTPSRNYYSS
ncbi:CPBP family intramembrane glutamic endopeptidase, partial [Shewanella benthica]